MPDTSRVQLLWNLAEAYKNYNPDSSSLVAQQALFLARGINYVEGESRALGKLANSLLIMGKYPEALHNYLEKLKIEEKRNIPYNYGSVVMNIGIVYTFQEEYENALVHYKRADSIIEANKIPELDYKIALNIGDLYDRLSATDSSKQYTDTAYAYFLKAYSIGNKNNDEDQKGSALTGIGHCLVKKGKFAEANSMYHNAVLALQNANNEDLICEAYLGLAKSFNKLGKKDSSVYFANKSMLLAQKDEFLSREYDAADFLASLYGTAGKSGRDSAYAYLIEKQALKDSLGSKEKIRQVKALSMIEDLRQQEITLAKEKARKERKEQLQLLFIGIFIPAFFIITLLLSRIKLNPRLIRFMGILSLLILFEYLTLLLHPTVAELTHHTPLLEILIFVSIAAFLIPAHHRLEKWFVGVITRNKNAFGLKGIHVKKMKYSIKKSPPLSANTEAGEEKNDEENG